MNLIKYNTAYYTTRGTGVAILRIDDYEVFTIPYEDDEILLHINDGANNCILITQFSSGRYNYNIIKNTNLTTEQIENILYSYIKINEDIDW